MKIQDEPKERPKRPSQYQGCSGRSDTYCGIPDQKQGVVWVGESFWGRGLAPRVGWRYGRLVSRRKKVLYLTPPTDARYLHIPPANEALKMVATRAQSTISDRMFNSRPQGPGPSRDCILEAICCSQDPCPHPASLLYRAFYVRKGSRSNCRSRFAPKMRHRPPEMGMVRPGRDVDHLPSQVSNSVDPFFV
jgi:hypothetical protein